MVDAVHGVGPTKQDLIAALVQKELKASAMLAGLLTDVSQFAVKGMKSIAFPKLTSFTAVNRAFGAAADAVAVTATSDSLALDQNPYLAWIIDPKDAIQSTLNWELECAKRAASAHGRFVDAAIVAKLEAEAMVTTTAGSISRDIVLEMRELMRLNEGDLNQCTYVVSPDQETALLKIAEFTRADAYGSSNIPGGVLGRLFGVPVLVKNDLGASTYYLIEKSGGVLGFQAGPAMSTEPNNAYGVGCMRTAMDQLFGVKLLQIAQATAPAGKSALVIKDNN